jgi:hypothetical protein
VLKIIFEKENGGNAIEYKSSGEKLKKYFAEVLPAYDRDRVYVSDIKKVMLWYGILLENGLLNFTEEESDEEKADG